MKLTLTRCEMKEDSKGTPDIENYEVLVAKGRAAVKRALADHDANERWRSVIGPFSVYLSMLEAHMECAELGALNDKEVILHFMGSGASHRVTVKDLRQLIAFRPYHKGTPDG